MNIRCPRHRPRQKVNIEAFRRDLEPPSLRSGGLLSRGVLNYGIVVTKQVLNLVSHEDKLTGEEILLRTFIAVFLVRLLQFNKGLFK